ncbi:MAG: hypothetical protein JF606_19635 [Burkholderiales bacterium]|jgi:hypothetical protein|nr:hypothetical protein [Burkholderiales bacterium]
MALSTSLDFGLPRIATSSCLTRYATDRHGRKQVKVLRIYDAEPSSRWSSSRLGLPGSIPRRLGAAEALGEEIHQQPQRKRLVDRRTWCYDAAPLVKAAKASPLETTSPRRELSCGAWDRRGNLVGAVSDGLGAYRRGRHR